MINAPFELTHHDNNPLDLVEDLAHTKGWKLVERDSDYMSVIVAGQKSEYEVIMEWQEEFNAVLFSCAIPLQIKDEQYETAARTLEQINQNLWMGHFDLSTKGQSPTFRHTALFRMIPAGIAIDILQDTIDIAMSECDRFFTTFQLVQAGDVRLHDNMSAAVFETVGEA